MSPRTTTLDLASAWENLCADPLFKNSPHKVELTATGKIIMSPASNEHGFLQTRIARLLEQCAETGETGTEIAIQTTEGVYVADVVWCTNETFSIIRRESCSSRAPEICVEIMSDSNTLAEMEIKRAEYFKAGCQEFILIDRKHSVTFFSPNGQLEQSVLVSGFPAQIEL